MEVNKAIALRSLALLLSHSHVNAVAMKKGGPSKTPTGGIYSPTLIIVVGIGIH